MRAVMVVMGAETSPKRFEDAKKLFNYAFANYENKKLVIKGEKIENNVKVKGGKTNVVDLAPAEDIFALNKKGGGAKYGVEYELPEEIKAGIDKGRVIGKIIVKRDGEIIGSCDAVALNDVPKATLIDNIRKIVTKW
jgi:D-alanyl-D-alanine carboxypeptidase (penicillin-binding protein 5/6)